MLFRSYPPKNSKTDLPKPFVEYLCYSRTLIFKENPDYNYLKRLFSNYFVNQKLNENFILDWIKPNEIDYPVKNDTISKESLEKIGENKTPEKEVNEKEKVTVETEIIKKGSTEKEIIKKESLENEIIAKKSVEKRADEQINFESNIPEYTKSKSNVAKNSTIKDSIDHIEISSIEIKIEETKSKREEIKVEPINKSQQIESNKNGTIVNTEENSNRWNFKTDRIDEIGI